MRVGVYEAIVRAHRVNIDSEVKSVAGTLHDSLEPVLKQPGQLTPVAQEVLPNLCLKAIHCPIQRTDLERHRVSEIRKDSYYLRLVDRSGELVAFSEQLPEGLPLLRPQQRWQTLTSDKGIHYRQISLWLHTQDNRRWGYLQVGHSLEDIEDNLAAIRGIMLLGLSITMLFVGASSWWLAKLAMQPIYDSYRQIQQFTGDAAHELRTPLAAIQATIESTLRISQLSDSEARETLQVVKRQDQRLSQLVDSLLLLSRMERRGWLSRQNQYSHSDRVSLHDIVSDVAEELAPLAMAAGVKLITDIRVQQSLEVMGNEQQLYRLVTNLVTNGIQYTAADGKVNLTLDRYQQEALIAIQDTCIAIAPKQQTRIFDRFYRVNSDRSRITGGFGLGLPIAAAIAQAHQGSIHLQSQPGKGTTFTIRLPLKRR